MVRQRTLTPSSGGSNPPSPGKRKALFRNLWKVLFIGFLSRKGFRVDSVQYSQFFMKTSGINMRVFESEKAVFYKTSGLKTCTIKQDLSMERSLIEHPQND